MRSNTLMNNSNFLLAVAVAAVASPALAQSEVGVGLAAMAAGITGLAIGTVRLKRAKQKRRYLEYQMEELERALP